MLAEKSPQHVHPGEQRHNADVGCSALLPPGNAPSQPQPVSVLHPLWSLKLNEYLLFTPLTPWDL